MNASKRLGILAAGWLVLLHPQGAHAEPAGVTPAAAEQAQKSFDSAVAAMERGDFATACPALEESERLDPAGGTLLNLAYCWEKLQKWVSAARTYRSALSRAEADGRLEREEVARAGLARVMTKVARLRIAVPANLAQDSDVVVWVDTERLSLADLAYPQLVELGEHRVRVSAANREPETLAIATPEAAEYTANVPGLRPLAIAPARTPAPTTQPMPSPALGPRRPPSRTAFWATTASAGALLGVGTVAGILAAQKHAQSNRDCKPCTIAGVDEEKSANRLAWVANIGIATGVIAAGAALYLFVTEGSEPQQSAGFDPLRTEWSF